MGSRERLQFKQLFDMGTVSPKGAITKPAVVDRDNGRAETQRSTLQVRVGSIPRSCCRTRILAASFSSKSCVVGDVKGKHVKFVSPIARYPSFRAVYSGVVVAKLH